MRVILVVIGLLVWSGRADAYPQFQLSTGNDTCKQCHFAPGVGGLINEYGRDEAGSTISWKFAPPRSSRSFSTRSPSRRIGTCWGASRRAP